MEVKTWETLWLVMEFASRQTLVRGCVIIDEGIPIECYQTGEAVLRACENIGSLKTQLDGFKIDGCLDIEQNSVIFLRFYYNFY